MQKIKDRTGEFGISKQGLKMWIIEYRKFKDIDIKFENGYISKNKEYKEFKDGYIKNPYHPSVFRIGYIGEGKYLSGTFKNQIIQYKVWLSMLQRCYDEEFHIKNLSYIECTVCEEWHNFQHFAEWFDENYYEVDNEKMQIDKDFLVKGNKIYSPETCVFVPIRINNLLTIRQRVRGSCPIGVSYHKRDNVFQSNINKYNRAIYLGYYDTPEKAFEVYKIEKKKYIKEVADEYKNRIHQKLYDAMYKYEVEITD